MRYGVEIFVKLSPMYIANKCSIQQISTMVNRREN